MAPTYDVVRAGKMVLLVPDGVHQVLAGLAINS